MSKYVISDLHGCFDKLIQMLKKINFKTEDELYILGDIFDRGDKPLDILDYIISHKNIFLIKGNHEKLFEEVYHSDDFTLWFMNGGDTTFQQIHQRSTGQKDTIYKYIKKLPFIKVVDKFILVHGGLYIPSNFHEVLTIDNLLEIQHEDNCLWQRSHIGHEKQFKDYTIICGHTPVQNIEPNGEVKILHRLGHIYIDCGCCFEEANGRLACLRLDDLKEFYI